MTEKDHAMPIPCPSCQCWVSVPGTPESVGTVTRCENCGALWKIEGEYCDAEVRWGFWLVEPSGGDPLPEQPRPAVAAEHSPLPWEFGNRRIWDGASEIALLRGYHDIIAANGEFIVRACNCHDALVEAIRSLVAMYSEVAPYGHSPIVENARAALAFAQQETA